MGSWVEGTAHADLPASSFLRELPCISLSCNITFPELANESQADVVLSCKVRTSCFEMVPEIALHFTVLDAQTLCILHAFMHHTQGRL